MLSAAILLSALRFKKNRSLTAVEIKNEEKSILLSVDNWYLQWVSYMFSCILQETKRDIDVERQTYLQSRAGLDNMYAETKKRLDEEIQLRLVFTSFT